MSSQNIDGSTRSRWSSPAVAPARRAWVVGEFFAINTWVVEIALLLDTSDGRGFRLEPFCLLRAAEMERSGCARKFERCR